MMFFSVIPTCAYLIFNNVSINILLIQVIPLIFLTVASNTFKQNCTKTRNIVKMNNLNFILVFIFVCLLTIPFYFRLGDVNLNNLLLDDIYETRSAFKENTNLYISYLTSPLSKIIFPILAIYSIDRKKYLFALIAIINILILYLTTGAQKDVLVGIALILFCYIIAIKKGMQMSIKRIISWTSVFIAIEVMLYAVKGLTIITIYIRRVFFGMPGLLGEYYEYFTENGFTYYSQTRLGSIGSERLILTTWAGEHIFGKEINANIGIFAEGYVSLGFLGVIIASILFTIICIYINKLNIESKYIGLWIAMLYLVNFSLFETLLITHGLLLFIIVARFFIPSKKQSVIMKN